MNNRKPKQNKQNKNRNKKSRSQDGWRVAPNAVWRLPRTVSQLIPDRMMTRLTYNGAATMTIPAGQQVYARRWRPSSVYDVDPLIGSTTVVGFTEMATLYFRYRVLRSKIRIRCANQSSVPVNSIILPLNADPTSSPSTATVQSWFNNPYSKLKLVPAAGAPTVDSIASMSTEKIYGSKSVYFDDDFAALTNSSPVNNWYWGVAIAAADPAAAAINVVVELDFQIDCEFFTRRNLLN